MLIKESNRERIEKMIKAAEGRATARLISFDTIERAIADVEKQLGVSKKVLEGVKVWVDYNAQTFPNAYKHTAYSTHFLMVRKKGGWDLRAVERMPTNQPKHRYDVTITDAARDAILQRMSHFE